MMKSVSTVNLSASQFATCFREGPDGFLGLFGDTLELLDALLLLLLFTLLFPVLLAGPAFDFLIFLLALESELVSESVSDSLLTPPNDGLCVRRHQQ